MVFVWSHLTKGDAAYTLVQVAVNDLIILAAFAPIVALLLGVGGVTIPWDTLFLSVLLFVVIPLSAGVITRTWVIRRKGIEYFNHVFIRKFDNYTVGGLLLTLIILFFFSRGNNIKYPLTYSLDSRPACPANNPDFLRRLWMGEMVEITPQCGCSGRNDRCK